VNPSLTTNLTFEKLIPYHTMLVSLKIVEAVFYAVEDRTHKEKVRLVIIIFFMINSYL